jgi:hypothetical protein
MKENDFDWINQNNKMFLLEELSTTRIVGIVIEDSVLPKKIFRVLGYLTGDKGTEYLGQYTDFKRSQKVLMDWFLTERRREEI